MKSDALLQAIRKAGSITKLASLIGVAPQAISQWNQAPPMRVLAIERATGVSRYELRPDIYPPDPRKPRVRRPESNPPPPRSQPSGYGAR